MFGEDADNRGAMLWINNSNELRLGYKAGGTDYGAAMVLKDGDVGIGTSSPGGRLHVVGSAEAHGIAVYAEAVGSSGIGLVARGGTTAAKFYGNVAVYSANDESLVMELGEGLDYAEGFDVSDRDAAAPGTVLSIDPAHPGQLKVSDQSYDSRVAGIVAGANGLGSGVRLGAGGFDHDVALAGRVYCNVDASQEAIEPGDLLTTSSTPGYAMKVTDFDRARGAVLGKAMQSLEEGHRGQILVLVTLQ
jgi:hypothetical protein